jgi:SWI/SNF-related matrix-associated actin-dependent regulator of chromatin subfamily A member 5
MVVVPLSVLFNWALELRRFCPQLKVLRVHTNSSNEQKRLREILNTFTDTSKRPQYDVVITTYEMIKGKMENAFRRVMWRSMVLDEGHRIKNEMTDISRSCMLFKARFKLVLTG